MSKTTTKKGGARKAPEARRAQPTNGTPQAPEKPAVAQAVQDLLATLAASKGAGAPPSPLAMLSFVGGEADKLLALKPGSARDAAALRGLRAFCSDTVERWQALIAKLSA